MSEAPDAEILIALVEAIGGEDSTFLVDAPLANTPVAPASNKILVAEFGGKGFEPPESHLWIELKPFPSPPTSLGHGGKLSETAGYLQASCCIKRRSKALFYTSKLAVQIAQLFPMNRRFALPQGSRFKISRPVGIGGAINDDGEVRIPVAIYYQHPAG